MSRELGSVIVGLLPAEFKAAGEDLAAKLTACAAGLPATSTLILGGSLARGEPLLRLTPDGYTLISDIDLLLVHDSVLPPFAPEEFVAQHAPALPTITLMSLSGAEYQRMRTSLGYDFKDGGIPLGRPALPAAAPVTITDRDAREVFIFTVFLYFFEHVGRRWLAGDESADVHHSATRVCGKLLRSVGMLHQLLTQHETVTLPGPLGEAAARELAWLRSPGKADPPPLSRIWPMFAHALRAHDEWAGAPVVDAVTGTEYEQRPGGGFIAEHHAVAMRLLRDVLARLDLDLVDRDSVKQATDAAWYQLVADGVVRPFRTPEHFFAARAASIRDQLLRMKV